MTLWDPAPAGRRHRPAVATHFPAPASYTGDGAVELSAHGSPVILEAVVSGRRMWSASRAGEFTLRAFLHRRIDLSRRSVADLIGRRHRCKRAAFDQLDSTLTRTIAAIGATLFD